MAKSIGEVGVEDFLKAGLTIEEAHEFQRVLKDALSGANESDPREAWRELVARKVLKPWHPHGLHQLLYHSVYANWDASTNGPPPYWFPSLYHSKHTNVGRLMEKYGSKLLGTSYKDPITSFSLFQKFSVQHPEAYWEIVLKELAVSFRDAPNCILDTTDKSKHGGTWLPGSVLNIAECCLLPRSHPRKEDSSLAVVWRDEGCDDDNISHMTLKEFREQVMLVANALDAIFSKGDAIAIDMPMTVNAVIIYLAIVLAGCAVVSIADSFAAKEIATRLRVSKAKGIFTQESQKLFLGHNFSPIRCAADSWAHIDVQVGDIYCCPTNLGWLLGPIFLYSCFLNGATLALYRGSPLGRSLRKFGQAIIH